MADNITLARPYAKAAFEYALSNNATDLWLGMLERMSMVAADPQTKACLLNPKITKEKILSLFVELTQQPLSQPMLNYLQLLGDSHRLVLLPQILELYKEHLSAHEKKIEVSVVSPFLLGEKIQDKLQVVLQKRLQRTVKLHCEVDKTLIGGVVIRAGDFVIDGSLRSKLQRLNEMLVA